MASDDREPVVPSSMRNLRACLGCMLVKTQGQFLERGTPVVILYAAATSASALLLPVTLPKRNHPRTDVGCDNCEVLEIEGNSRRLDEATTMNYNG